MTGTLCTSKYTDGILMLWHAFFVGITLSVFHHGFCFPSFTQYYDGHVDIPALGFMFLFETKVEGIFGYVCGLLSSQIVAVYPLLITTLKMIIMHSPAETIYVPSKM
jgi:uncharacterized membrane protein YagU involved in acid resistance